MRLLSIMIEDKMSEWKPICVASTEVFDESHSEPNPDTPVDQIWEKEAHPTEQNGRSPPGLNYLKGVEW